MAEREEAKAGDMINESFDRTLARLYCWIRGGDFKPATYDSHIFAMWICLDFAIFFTVAIAVT